MNADFTSNTIEIEISSGPNYPKIRLRVNEFRPLNQETLALDLVAPKEDGDEQCFKFIQSYAPPLGLDATGGNDLRSLCLEHIKFIIERERDIGEADHGDISIISWKVFEAVNRYRRSNRANCNVSYSICVRFIFIYQLTIYEESSSKEGCNAPCNALLHEPYYYLHERVCRESD